MHMKLGMGPAIILGLVAYAATGGNAAAREAGGLTGQPVSRVVQTRCEPETSTPETEALSNRALPDAPIHRSEVDESLRHEYAQHHAPTRLPRETREARVAKDAAQREAAQFGVIAVLSTIRGDFADAPSGWARTSTSEIARGPAFDGAIEGQLPLALSSTR
jgi:hypothetical protein